MDSEVIKVCATCKYWKSDDRINDTIADCMKWCIPRDFHFVCNQWEVYDVTEIGGTDTNEEENS